MPNPEFYNEFVHSVYSCPTRQHSISKYQTYCITDVRKSAPCFRALCEAAPQQVPKVVDYLNPILSSVYDAQRIVVAAFFAEVCWMASLFSLL